MIHRILVGVVFAAVLVVLWIYRRPLIRAFERGSWVFLLAAGVGWVCSGCSSPLAPAAAVANAAAATGEAVAPLLEAQCVKPMQAAAAVNDVAAAKAVAAKCDPLIAAYDTLRAAHVALRAAIVVAAGSGDLSQVAPLMAELVKAATTLERDIVTLTRTK